MSFMRALQCQNFGRPPIWLMRQAGRYLPKYRAMRRGRSLLEMFHSPKTIVEVTELPIDVLNVDAAILFNDILTVFDGMSIRYDFQENIGPVVFDSPNAINMRDPYDAYCYVIQAIQTLKKQLSIPLIGFAGGPFTIASYLIEKKSSQHLKKTKQLLYREPEIFLSLIEKITEATIAYLNCQVEAGVDAIQIFDSWAHVLAFSEFNHYCLKPMRDILNAIDIPTILFCRGSSLFAPELATLHPAAISIDWNGSLPLIRKLIPQTVALQGNLDPMVLYGSQKEIASAIDRLLEGMKEDPGYIFNLGHGLLPDIPLENVKFMVDYVRLRSC
ncbi:MAG: uroporphyrinogen decarboxylase [Chlamydiales bacterium]